MREIMVAIAGVGNCAASLIDGVDFYKKNADATGLITRDVADFSAGSMSFVAAFDVDSRKVSKSLYEAISALPNNARRLCTPSNYLEQVIVEMGPILDGIAPHTAEYPIERRISPSSETPVDVADVLRRSKAEVLVCYLPVGSTRAVRYYADAALAAGVAFVNCVPVFIANDPQYAHIFADRRIPLIGDDVRSQVGATIVHQRLVELLTERGYDISRSYQLNIGGNADFLNMLDRSRLVDKKRSKTNAVAAKIRGPIDPVALHIGPSDYVPHLEDTKVAFIRTEAVGFGGAPLTIDARLEVEDSPNSAAVVLDAIRYAAVALDRGIGGVIDPVCSYYMKSPPQRLDDAKALQLLAELSSVSGMGDPGNR